MACHAVEFVVIVWPLVVNVMMEQHVNLAVEINTCIIHSVCKLVLLKHSKKMLHFQIPVETFVKIVIRLVTCAVEQILQIALNVLILYIFTMENVLLTVLLDFINWLKVSITSVKLVIQIVVNVMDPIQMTVYLAKTLCTLLALNACQIVHWQSSKKLLLLDNVETNVSLATQVVVLAMMIL